MSTNRQWVLSRRPNGAVTVDHFQQKESELAPLVDGQVLVRNRFLSFDPAMRGWITDRKSYLPPVEIGAVMRAGTAGEVVESKHPDFAAGDRVQGMGGWQEFAVIAPGRGMLSKIPDGITMEQSLSVFGITGLTAYVGMLDICQPTEGDVVLVSGAAGATGSVAGQIAKIKGASTVVGIAGGPDKCRWLTEHAHFDAAIDYKAQDVRTQVAQLCETGIDAFFDNVGGATLEAALGNLRRGARIALCGAISGYDVSSPPPGPRNLANLIVQRASMRGFIVLDHLDRATTAIAEMAQWVQAGDIAYRVDVQRGFANIPATFLRLFAGANFGKQLLQLED
jgi:NADPH-dependent curcumin reductase CurA